MPYTCTGPPRGVMAAATAMVRRAADLPEPLAPRMAMLPSLSGSKNTVGWAWCSGSSMTPSSSCSSVRGVGSLEKS